MNNTRSSTLIRHLPIAILFGAVNTLISFYSEGIHLPFMINLVLSISLGWLEPRKGWILALAMGASTLISFFILTSTEILLPQRGDIARFAVYLGCSLPLVGSYMGGFFNRAIKNG
ncbi:hypothetical protein CLV98_106130 [Dyadobacter jejuensis]|uniref:TIGR04086 family membrane protein n=1 Tax=Dyadobacter jejuensis TaxID=1082580 RepID=A0A316AJX9_9BACT|nr:hypothetical protein [Dyadobacter jejuensis]PWJ57658.1 hypothetical protein CLV98_106130 [Dyadobacter jejuensis]